MAKGPAPKPTTLKVLAGNPGKRPLNSSEPRPPARSIRAPDYLDEEARKKWDKLARKLKRAGLLTEIDVDALAAYCIAFVRWQKAEKEVVKLGLIVTTSNGNPIQNPYLAVANRSFEQMRKLEAEFGMTPSSRTRIKVDQPANDATLAEQLFAGIQAARQKREAESD